MAGTRGRRGLPGGRTYLGLQGQHLFFQVLPGLLLLLLLLLEAVLFLLQLPDATAQVQLLAGLLLQKLLLAGRGQDRSHVRRRHKNGCRSRTPEPLPGGVTPGDTRTRKGLGNARGGFINAPTVGTANPPLCSPARPRPGSSTGCFSLGLPIGWGWPSTACPFCQTPFPQMSMQMCLSLDFQTRKFSKARMEAFCADQDVSQHSVSPVTLMLLA